jgi:acetylglutamate kinase
MNVQVLRDLYNAGIIPVVAPVATGVADNETFNVNGDTAAGAIAAALKADRLLLLTDVPGVRGRNGEVVTQLHPEEVRAMIADGTISGGMIPKVETALAAVDGGVRAAVILDGRLPHACLLELFTDHGAGSIIRSTEPRVKPRGGR